jgi:putative endonuclease
VKFRQIMFYYVYVLEDIIRGRRYIGYTTNLQRRVREHNQKENFSTQYSSQWKCIYFEACLNQRDALRREKYIKTTQGQRLLKLRLKEYFYRTK